jgi:hypothetical protein
VTPNLRRAIVQILECTCESFPETLQFRLDSLQLAFDHFREVEKEFCEPCKFPERNRPCLEHPRNDPA